MPLPNRQLVHVAQCQEKLGNFRATFAQKPGEPSNTSIWPPGSDFWVFSSKLSGWYRSANAIAANKSSFISAAIPEAPKWLTGRTDISVKLQLPTPIIEFPARIRKIPRAVEAACRRLRDQPWPPLALICARGCELPWLPMPDGLMAEG